MNKKILPLIACVAVEVLFLIFFHCTYVPYVCHDGVVTESWWLESDRMVSTTELNSDLLQWKEFTNFRQSISKEFAYSKIIIENKSHRPHSYYIVNQDVNAYASCLEFRGLQVISVDRRFDNFNRPIYKVNLLPGERRSFFLELSNGETIGLSPIVLDEKDFYPQGIKEQFFLWALVVLTAFCSINLVFYFFVLENRFLLVAGLASIFVVIVYLFTTSLIHPIFDGSSFWLGKKYLLRSFEISFILGLVVLILDCVRHYNDHFRNLNYQTTLLSFVPWLLFEGIKIVGSLMNLRIFFEHVSLLSWFLSLMTYGIFIIRSCNITQITEQEEILSYFTLTSKISFKNLLRAKSVPSQMLIKVRDKIQQPLDIIQTISNMAEGTTDLGKMISYATVINEYVLEIKKILGLELSYPNEKGAFSHSELEMFKDTEMVTDFKDQTLCIYGSDDDVILSEKIVLNGDGFFCVSVSSYEDIAGGIESGEYQMLVINPATDGEEVFELCRKIRENYNVFQFPILMVINYYANYLVRRGYSVGVNDFIIRPFDSSELVSRCYSLLQLKRIFLHNQELSRQENEKSTFLYFVTHNVNTPLTLLLNRLDDFSRFLPEMNTEAREIFLDIKDSVNEIDGIIQNVLISFRISDGRYVNVQEKLFVEDILDVIRPVMEGRASAKNVKIDWQIPDILPQIKVNRQALRGIVTNLIDNAIKYSPENGTVWVKIVQEALPESESTAGTVGGAASSSSYSTAVAATAGSRMVLSVSDEGDGVPSSKIPLLFSRFDAAISGSLGSQASGMKGTNSRDGTKNSSQKPTSVGLGLYVANELAKLNGIKLEYSDAQEGGACFTLYFTEY